MAKTKITNKLEESKKESAKEITGEGEAKVAAPKIPKKKVTSGILSIDATFNNTKVLLADKGGNTLFWSSAGSLGFRGPQHRYAPCKAEGRTVTQCVRLKMWQPDEEDTPVFWEMTLDFKGQY